MKKKIRLEDIGRKLGELEVLYPKKFLLAILFISLLMIPGLLQIKIEPSLEKVLPQDLDVLKQMNSMRDQFGADMVYVFYELNNYHFNDIRSPEILKQIELTEDRISRERNVLMINSIVSMFKDYNNGVLSDDYEKNKEIYEFAKSIGDPRLDLINHDFTIILSEIKTNTGSNAGSINQLIDDIEYNLFISNDLDLKLGLTGYNALDKATFELIISDFSYTTFIAFAFVAIIVYFTFKSLSLGMIPMLVVMVSLLWTNGTVGYLGIPMTVASMGAAAMVMGLGIDFGIHIISIYREFRKKGLEINESIILTLEKDIRAIVGTAITTIAGFISLWFSSLPAMADLGTILLFGIFYSMILALFLMMPLLYFYENKINKINKSKLN